MLWTYIDSRHMMANKRQRKVGNISAARLQANRVFYPHRKFSNSQAFDEQQQQLLSRAKDVEGNDMESERQRKRETLGRRAFIALCTVFLVMWATPAGM